MEPKSVHKIGLTQAVGVAKSAQNDAEMLGTHDIMSGRRGMAQRTTPLRIPYLLSDRNVYRNKKPTSRKSSAGRL